MQYPRAIEACATGSRKGNGICRQNRWMLSHDAQLRIRESIATAGSMDSGLATEGASQMRNCASENDKRWGSRMG
jgi:hypothetical protein